MNAYIKFLDDAPFILKLIFALPGINIIWGIYRLLKGVRDNNLVLILAGIVWIFAGWAILWIIDLITVIISGRPTVLV